MLDNILQYYLNIFLIYISLMVGDIGFGSLAGRPLVLNALAHRI